MKKVNLCIPDDLYEELEGMRKEMEKEDRRIILSRVFRKAIRAEIEKWKEEKRKLAEKG